MLVTRYHDWTSTAANLALLQTDLTDMGQTLQDTPDATSKVFKSDGEAGDRIPEYVRVYSSTNGLYWQCYGEWDTTTHTGTMANYTGYNYLTITGRTPTGMWVYGSKDLVFVRVKSGTYDWSSRFFFGHFKRFYDKPLAKITSPITAGSNVVIPIDDTGSFKVGSSYQIVGQNFEGRATVAVTGIGASDLTVSSLTVAFSTNSLIGHSPSLFGSQCTNGVDAISFTHPSGATDGTAQQASTASYGIIRTGTWTISDLGPDGRQTPIYLLVPMIGSQRGLNVIIDSSFCEAPTTTEFDLYGVLYQNNQAIYVAGTYDATSVTDANKSQTIGALIGKAVIIYEGVGIGQSRIITANTATKISFNAQTTVPDASSKFMIVDEAQRNMTSGSYWAAKEVM